MKLRNWLNENAFLLALILVVLAVTPGYIRLEGNVRNVEDLIYQDRIERLTRCQEANDSRAQIRDTFHDAFEQLQPIGADPEFIQQLHSIVPTPEDTDIDCNSDGVLDEEDYSARPR